MIPPNRGAAPEQPVPGRHEEVFMDLLTSLLLAVLSIVIAVLASPRRQAPS